MNPTHNITDLSPAALFGTLPVMKIRFRIQFPGHADHREYDGFAWRGLIGREIQRLVCPFDRRPPCEACAIKDHCPYFLLIEKNTPLSGLFESPRGYIIYSPGFQKGPDREFFITLIGGCARFLPVMVKAVFESRRVGLGKNRDPFEVASWEEIGPDSTIRQMPLESDGCISVDGPFPLSAWLKNTAAPLQKLSVRFLTPFRLRQRGKYLSEPDWPFYFSTLARRLEALNCLFNNGQPLGKERWADLQEAFQVTGNIQTRLRWWDMDRYSTRQRKKVPMGGIAGDLVMENPSPFYITWWKAAELLHVGKGAAMGLGKVEIWADQGD
jgi:hypothetical protein